MSNSVLFKLQADGGYEMSDKRLVCSTDDRMVFGVCAGLAEYLNIDPVLVRLIFVLLAVTGGHGILLYVIMAILMPEGTAVSAKANGFNEEEIVVKEA
jgi:phage shock protein PspC (stress-responsive transcriptional regulator)